MSYQKRLVYLTEAQKDTLFETGSVTVGDKTIVYDDNDVYVTPQEEPVTDVQVNGVSVVDNGVATIPAGGVQDVQVNGTTPTITALPGVRYVCGEVSTLDITLPASGCVDVVFESGSTPTVLTVTPPSGVTVKWANGIDLTALQANTTYEINIADGLGVAASWT